MFVFEEVQFVPEAQYLQHSEYLLHLSGDQSDSNFKSRLPDSTVNWDSHKKENGPRG